MESRYAFRVPDTRRVYPVVDGEVARTHLPLAKAKAQGFEILEWPTDPAGAVSAVDLGEYIPRQPDAADTARLERMTALAGAAEADGVSPDVIRELAANADMPLADARAFMRGLSPDSIASQFSISIPKEQPMTSTPNPEDGAKAKRLSEIRSNVSPATGASALSAADTDAKRERLLEIKIGGVMSRAEAGNVEAKAKRREIERADALAKAERIPRYAAMAMLGITI